MRDEKGIEKWLALEMGKLQRGLVPAPRPLGDLAREAQPTAPTRGGGVHVFDRGVIERLHAAAGPLARRRVRLPVSFFVEHETPQDAYLTDEHAWGLLQDLGEAPREASMREGKGWLGLARARSLALRYPTAFQFVHL